MAAAAGVLFSAFLTVVKFKSSYHCDFAHLSACSDTCSRVLTSDYSTLFGAPLSIYSAAYFLVVLGLALALLWRPTLFAAVARPLLLVFAVLGLAIVGVLATYAFAVVGGLCNYCMIIYGLTLTAAIGVSLMQTSGYRASFRAFFTGRTLKSTTFQMAVLTLMAATSVQMLVYRRNARSAAADPRCVVLGHIPPTPLETAPPRTPRARIDLFVDLACRHCARVFADVDAYVADHPGQVQLGIYHFARTGECMPKGAEHFNGLSQDKDSCMAAKATLCAERLAPGAGLEMVRRLFALQALPDFSFADDRLLADAAQAAGVPDLPADLAAPDARDAPFFECIYRPPAALVDAILLHAQSAIHEQAFETPIMFITPYKDGHPYPGHYRIRGDKERSVEAMLSEAERALTSSTDPEAR